MLNRTPKSQLRVNFAVAWLVLFCCPFGLAADDNWPQFRGHQALGIGGGKPPTTWDTTTGRNVAWKTAIPGLGLSSPIVWGDRVYVTTAVNSRNEKPSLSVGWLGGTGKSPVETGEWQWQVMCLSLKDGSIVWSRTLHTGEPVVGRHLKASHANCTPATDGRHLIVFFGTEGLFCLGLDGQLRWKRDFGLLHSGPYDSPDLEWGFSSSPIIYRDRVVVQCDCLNINFTAVLDIANGNETLRIDRSGEVATWSTPAVIETPAGPQIVCNGYHKMSAYDFGSGREVWSLSQGETYPCRLHCTRTA